MDYDHECKYAPSMSIIKGRSFRWKRYALNNELDLESHWIQRQYILRSLNDKTLMGFSGAIEWRVIDKMHHVGTSSWFLGGCSVGDGIDQKTRMQFLKGTTPRYLVDSVKYWTDDHQYRGHITRGQAEVSQWFSWKTEAGKLLVAHYLRDSLLTLQCHPYHIHREIQ